MATTHVIEDDALPAPEVVALGRAALSSGYVGRSQLIGAFESSRGFGLVFRFDALAEVTGRFPWLGPLWPRIAEGGSRGALDASPADAGYLNLLVVEDGASVGRHVDGTLQELTGIEGLTPLVVSVLYLEVPAELEGGALRLFAGPLQTAVVQPSVGRLVHFAGHLGHEVTAVRAPSGRRVSLVCEQYVLPADALERVPRCRVQSRAPDPVFAPAPSAPPQGFAETLARRQKPTGGLE